MKFILSIISSLIFFGTAYAELGNLSNPQLKQMKDEGVVMVDIRRAEEWQQTGVIEGSHLLTFFDKKGNYNVNQWIADLAKITNKNDKLILICRSGNRTGMVGNFLHQKLGFPQVYHLKNGIKRWDGQKKQIISTK